MVNVKIHFKLYKRFSDSSKILMIFLFLLYFFSISEEINIYCPEEELMWPNQNHNMIEENRFRNCYKATGDLNIPSHITRIRAYAFYNCSG